MGLRQLHTAETMFIDDGLTDGAVFPPSSNAVYDALQNAIELPSVTAEDDGDVLTVVSGAWAKATPSGGGALVITATESEGTHTLDKTYAEISEWFGTKGVAIIFDDVPNRTNAVFAVVGCSYDSSATAYCVDTTEQGYYATTEDDYPSYSD